ncbi:hypothetical protein HNQ38_001730 [Desulfovibrio intestinalis]|uniref:Uncharacterized protein n=1 Tax=Desulfovibrio intestinalis TaxID=58621 RepID=A0A7W8C127_9BACT|nr:hypothetical protein [Desulfovibrio intestinalis]
MGLRPLLGPPCIPPEAPPALPRPPSLFFGGGYARTSPTCRLRFFMTPPPTTGSAAPEKLQYPNQIAYAVIPTAFENIGITMGACFSVHRNPAEKLPEFPLLLKMDDRITRRNFLYNWAALIPASLIHLGTTLRHIRVFEMHSLTTYSELSRQPNPQYPDAPKLSANAKAPDGVARRAGRSPTEGREAPEARAAHPSRNDGIWKARKGYPVEMEIYGKSSGVVRGECRGGLGGAAAPNRPLLPPAAQAVPPRAPFPLFRRRTSPFIPVEYYKSTLPI